MRARLALLPAVLALAGAAPARADDPYCTASYAGGPARPAPLRFGVDPEPAGSVGPVQSSSKPEDPARRDAALRALRPPGRELVLRINRLFWSDGDAGIARFRTLVAHDAGLGFDVEVQVRYHPPAGSEGDMAAWTAYVRRVVDALAPERRVVAMTITNEDNVTFSPNTSDGAYQGAVGATIAGIVAARAEADAIGRRDLALGFTYAWRFDPRTDAAFWQALAGGGAAFRAALSFVGLDAYPGSVYPPALAPGQTAGSALLDALATTRRCWMPEAALGASVPIWLTELGYPTTPGAHTEADQAAALGSMIDAAHENAATYGLTDVRWFNLRDNDSSSTGIFDTDGLLRDDYSPKPSLEALRARVAAFGTAAPATAAPGTSPASRRRRVARRRHARRQRRARRRRERVPSFTG